MLSKDLLCICTPLCTGRWDYKLFPLCIILLGHFTKMQNMTEICNLSLFPSSLPSFLHLFAHLFLSYTGTNHITSYDLSLLTLHHLLSTLNYVHVPTQTSLCSTRGKILGFVNARCTLYQMNCRVFKNTVHTSYHLTTVRIVAEGFLAGIGLVMHKSIVFNVVTHCSLFEGPETLWHPDFFGYILGQACLEGLPCNHLTSQLGTGFLSMGGKF